MPVNKRALTPATAVCPTGGLAIGSTVGASHRRYIYSIKTENQYAGSNVLTLTRNGTTVDVLFHLGLGDMVSHPDEPKEDSLPIYILGPGETLTGTTDNGDCFVRILFADGV